MHGVETIGTLMSKYPGAFAFSHLMMHKAEVPADFIEHLKTVICCSGYITCIPFCLSYRACEAITAIGYRTVWMNSRDLYFQVLRSPIQPPELARMVELMRE